MRDDFDEIALREPDSVWTFNEHYHPLLLKELGPAPGRVLEVGCGAGGFALEAAARAAEVTAVDLSEKMIAKAVRRSDGFDNISWRTGDYFDMRFPAGGFDHIVSIAAVHHFSMSAFVRKARGELRPGGKLLILDLFEPAGPLERAAAFLAYPAGQLLRLRRNGFRRPAPAERAAWRKHAAADRYPTLAEVRRTALEHLPEASVRRLFFWRYLLIWQKPLRPPA